MALGRPHSVWTVALPPDAAAPPAAVRADTDTPALRSARWREMETSFWFVSHQMLSSKVEDLIKTFWMWKPITFEMAPAA